MVCALSRKAIRDKKSLADCSPLMIDVMHCLMNDAQLDTSVLSIYLNIQQLSISYIMKDMMKEALVITIYHKYKFANFGKIDINLVDYLKGTTDFVKHNNLFLVHAIDRMIISSQICLGMTSSQEEPSNDNISNPSLKQEYPIRHTGAYKEIRFYNIKKANMDLWITESNLFLALCRPDGFCELEGIILKSKDSQEGGNIFFVNYRKQAQSVKIIAA